MSRVHDRQPAFDVGKALELLTPKLRQIIACEFVIGVDPVLAGVHRFQRAADGRPYSETPHCVYDIHQGHRPVSDRGIKIILPRNPAYGWGSWGGVETVVHELGHVLHARTEPDHIADPVSAYAHTNHREAFAEAFREWIWGGRIDERTAALFDRAAKG